MDSERRITISLTMTPQLLQQVTEEAKALGMTRSALISYAVAEFLRSLPNRKEQ